MALDGREAPPASVFPPSSAFLRVVIGMFFGRISRLPTWPLGIGLCDGEKRRGDGSGALVATRSGREGAPRKSRVRNRRATTVGAGGRRGLSWHEEAG